MFKTILVEKKNKVAKVSLNRPESLNAVSDEMLQELETAMEELEHDKVSKVVILTGAGRAFCAGADLKYAKGFLSDLEGARSYLNLFHRVVNKIENLSKPVIAAVNGLALAGGLELVGACDIVIASQSARLGDQHINFGLIPGGGNSQRLPRIVGRRRAMEILLTGKWLSAEEAERIGLVNIVTPDEKLEETAENLAQELAKKSRSAMRNIKSLVHRGMETSLPLALEMEIETTSQHMLSEDVKEGIDAFENKRAPIFE